MSALRGSGGSGEGRGAGKRRGPASKTTKLRAALRATEQKYRQLVQSANSIIMRRDVEGRVTFFNEFAQQFFGYDEDEILGRHVIGTILPERDSAGRDMAEMIREINEHPEWYTNNQNENVRRDGERVWVAWTNRPIFDDDGKLVEILAVGNDISDRKRAEDALRESDDRLRSLLRSLNVGVYRTTGDSDGRFLEANPAMARILGYDSVAELMTVRVCDLYPRPGDRITSLSDTATRPGGRVKDKELRLRRKDGELIWASITSQITLDENGGIRWVDGVMEDITERRGIAEELRREKDRAQRYLDVAAVMIVAMDGEGRVTLANRRTCEVLGYADEGDLIGRVWFDRFLPEDLRERAKRALGRLMSGDLTAMKPKVSPLLTRGGQEHVISWRSVPIRDDDGKIVGVVSSGTDVTDLKLAEEALRTSEARYRMVFENAHEGISVHEMLPDGGKRLIDCNERYVQMSGRSRKELMEIGDVTSLQVSRLSEEEEAEIRSSADEATAHSGAMSWKRPDGRENFTEYTCGFLESGGRRFAVGIDRDVTERRRARRETRVLEERLRQGEKMQAIGELAGGVAHDFNNQLAAIMGCAEMLQRKLADDALARYADIIVQACARAADVTGQLLAFARKGKVRTAPVNVHAVVDEVVALLEHSIDKRIRVRRRLNAADPTVMGDPTQLQNALLNIAINARDAMPDGGYLTFSSEDALLGEAEILALPYEMEPGRYVKVSVSDTGVGMDARTRKHIFEPFFTTKDVGKGTGMGLAAVYGTVKSHHGAIEVESAPGKGSTFTVLLPVGAPEDDDSESGDDLPRSGRAARVLVVDDEELVREAAAGMLGVLGYEALPCATGKQAVELYAKRWREIDLVLLDMVMPVMNGTETFAALREVNPGVKVVLSSGYSLDGEAQKLLEEGVVSFVQKPYRTTDLAAHLSTALES